MNLLWSLKEHREMLSQLEIIAIEMASRGCISGSLEEWHVLVSAFRKLDLPCEAMIRSEQARNLAKLIVSNPEW